MDFTETEPRSNSSYTQFDIPKNGRVRHLANQLWDELISIRQNNSKLQYMVTLVGRERMTQSWQKFAVLSTRSPCFSATSETFFHRKIFLLSICRSKDSWEKGNITDSQFDYCAKIKFIKFQQQFNK